MIRVFALRALVLASVLIPALAASPASLSVDPTAPSTEPARQEPLRILFVGNSYTGHNDLPSMIRQLAAAGGQRPVRIGRALRGGATFRTHVEGEGSPTPRAIRRGWDVVVLQEQSRAPFARPQEMLAYGAKLGELVERADAEPLLFMTWARLDQPELQSEIAETYRALGDALDAPVAPVGLAWEAALRERKGIVLHARDGSHPSPAGSYLAALVIYAVLFEVSPEELPHRLRSNEGELLVDLSAEIAAGLQAVARRTVEDL